GGKPRPGNGLVRRTMNTRIGSTPELSTTCRPRHAFNVEHSSAVPKDNITAVPWAAGTGNVAVRCEAFRISTFARNQSSAEILASALRRNLKLETVLLALRKLET